MFQLPETQSRAGLAAAHGGAQPEIHNGLAQMISEGTSSMTTVGANTREELHRPASRVDHRRGLPWQQLRASARQKFGGGSSPATQCSGAFTGSWPFAIRTLFVAMPLGGCSGIPLTRMFVLITDPTRCATSTARLLMTTGDERNSKLLVPPRRLNSHCRWTLLSVPHPVGYQDRPQGIETMPESWRRPILAPPDPALKYDPEDSHDLVKPGTRSGTGVTLPGNSSPHGLAGRYWRAL